MKAAVLYEVNKPLVIEDGVEWVPPASHEVLVRVVASGVCHSDLHFLDGAWPANLPLILGHEAAGIVEEVGTSVTAVQPGDHVVVLFAPFCGTCEFCHSGRPNLCQQGARVPGTTRGPKVRKGEQGFRQLSAVGSFAEYIVVPEGGVVRIRKDAPLDKVCLVGCAVMTGVGAVVNTAKVPTGASVAVIGCGGVGLNIVQGSILAGADPIIAIDLLETKLEMAKRFGATHAVNASVEDPLVRTQELTNGGAEFVFEAIGNPKTIEQAFAMTRRGGTCIVVGMAPWDSTITISPVDLFLNEKRLLGCYYGSTRPRIDIPRIIDLYMSGRLKLDELASRTYTLDQVNDAFEAMRRGEVARSIIRF